MDVADGPTHVVGEIVIDANQLLPPVRWLNWGCLISERAVVGRGNEREQKLSIWIDWHLIPRKWLARISGGNPVNCCGLNRTIRGLERAHIAEIATTVRERRHARAERLPWNAFLAPLLRPEEERFVPVLVVKTRDDYRSAYRVAVVVFVVGRNSRLKVI